MSDKWLIFCNLQKYQNFEIFVSQELFFITFDKICGIPADVFVNFQLIFDNHPLKI